MAYSLLYKGSVKKDLRKLVSTDLRLVVQKILSLTENPYPVGSVKLQGSLNVYRVRQGDYRIIYKVDQGNLIILIVKVGHRREVYQGL